MTQLPGSCRGAYFQGQTEAGSGGPKRDLCGVPPAHAKKGMVTGQTPKPEEIGSLYLRAFKDYGSRALWNMRPIGDPTPADALAITKALRAHGGMEGRRLAEQIERLCFATD
jgi:hypothetical protein